MTEFKEKDYKPYSTPPVETPTSLDNDYYLTKEELIYRLEELSDLFDNKITELRQKVSVKTIVNTGNDADFNKVVSSIFDEGSELPLSLYELAASSSNTKHQYLADIVLSAERGISGSYDLDILDVYKTAKKESDNLLAWFRTCKSDKDSTLIAVEKLVTALENITFYDIQSQNYSRLTQGYYRASKYETDTIKKAKAIQQEAHENIQKINSTLASYKRNIVELARASDDFYSKKLSKLDSTYPPDVARLENLISDHADIIEESIVPVFKAIGAGSSLKEDWKDYSNISNIEISSVASQAYVVENGNTSAAAETISKFASETVESFDDLEQIFIRRQGYSHSDAIAIVDILNSLPDTATYIRAGIIAVRAEPQFVEDLISQINNMPENSTMISGGMIALAGGKDLQTAIDDGDIGGVGSGYNTAEEVIEALNEFKGYTGGTILMPGVIGLTGGTGITQAIVDAINAPSNTSLIGAGAIRITGSNTLLTKASYWDQQLGVLSVEQADQSDLLSYFGITDSTLIDGNKIFTGDVLADSVRVGLRQIGSDTPTSTPLNVNDELIIDLGSSKYIKEIRTVLAPSWPALSRYLRLKVLVSSDGNTYRYVHGTYSEYLTLDKEDWSYLDQSNIRQYTPIIIPMDGNSSRYIKIVFCGWYQSDNLTLIAEGFSTTFRVYGASSWIDGGTIMAETLLIGMSELDTDVISALDSIDLTLANFNSRNDRISVPPSNPVITGMSDLTEINDDSTCSLTLTWEF